MNLLRPKWSPRSAEPSLARLLRAFQRVRRAEEELERARQEFYAEVMAARGAAASLSAMGRALGVSRQRMQKLVERIGRSG